MGIRALLLDADGVVQTNPAGWYDELVGRLSERAGDDFARAVFSAEQPAMVGRRRFEDVLAEVAGRWSLDDRLPRLLEHWHRVEVVPGVLPLVAQLRAAGLPCYLASNQHAHRAEYMRRALGYDDAFTGQFYSCEIGVTKDEPAYFERVCAKLGEPADQVLFVDDKQGYVDTARATGLRAACWCHDDGVPALRDLLRRHGVPGV
jgi:putative hydrolase of the HAD superfamily